MNLVHQRNSYDCLRCTVATMLQIPYEETPHYSRWAVVRPGGEVAFWRTWEEWAAARGLRWVFKDDGWKDPRGLWIGVTSTMLEGTHHALLFRNKTFIYDPREPGNPRKLRNWRYDDVIQGQTLRPL